MKTAAEVSEVPIQNKVMSKITLDQIQAQLAQSNWSLVSTEYKNLNSELVVQCPEGHLVYSTWNKLRVKCECPVCKQNKYKENTATIRPRKTGVERIVALDQASRKTGFAIFDGNELIHYGVFEAPDEDEAARIHAVKIWLLSLIENWKPSVLGIEAIQLEQKFGVTTFQTLARLQGVVLDLCYELQLPVKVVHSNTWRSHCGVKGKSRADRKKSMQLLVKQWYDITIGDDAADAIGIGKFVSETYHQQVSITDWE